MNPLDLSAAQFLGLSATLHWDADLPGGCKAHVASRVWLRPDLFCVVLMRVSAKWAKRTAKPPGAGYAAIVFSVEEPAYPLVYPTVWDRDVRRKGLAFPGWLQSEAKALRKAQRTVLALRHPYPVPHGVAKLTPEEGVRYFRTTAPFFGCHWHDESLNCVETVGSPGKYRRPASLAGRPVVSVACWVLTATSGVWVACTASSHRLGIILPSLNDRVRPKTSWSEWIPGQPSEESVRAWFRSKILLMGRAPIFCPPTFGPLDDAIHLSDLETRLKAFVDPKAFLEESGNGRVPAGEAGTGTVAVVGAERAEGASPE